jgi:DNA-directed RNA polymerase specialized sigma24 family protein
MACVVELTLEQELIKRLVYVEWRNPDVVATRLGIEYGALKQQLYRIRQKAKCAGDEPLPDLRRRFPLN